MNGFTFVSPNAVSRSLIRVAVKDNIAVKDMPLTCASKALQHFISPYDADCVAALKKTDRYCIVGKTNLDEFGMGSWTRHSVHGNTPHPVLPNSTPGGSSGGSAVAVFLDKADIGICSDTGGSTRLPAAFCGLIGFKPAYGAISRRGLVSYAPSLDCIGLLTTFGKIKTMWEAYTLMSSFSNGDMTCTGNKPTNIRPAKVTVLQKAKEYCDPVVWDATLNIVQDMANTLGLITTFSDWDRFEESIGAYYGIASIEALSCLQRYPLMSTGDMTYAKSNAVRTPEFGDEVKRRLKMAEILTRFKTFDIYDRACKIREKIATELREMATDSIVVLPTAPGPPPKLSSLLSNLEYDYDVFTIPLSLAGLPVWSIPCSKKWTGVQLCHANPQYVYDQYLLVKHLQNAANFIYNVDGEACSR